MFPGGGSVDLGSAHGAIYIDQSGIDAGLQQAQRAFDNALTSIGGRLSEFGDGMSRIGGSLTLLTAPLTAFGVTGVRTAATFQQAMTEISARTGLVGEDLERVRQFALQMGADTVFSGQQAADAFLQLLTSGSSVAESMEILPSVLNAAATSGGDLGQTADTLTDIMAAFGLEAGDAAGVVDSLARASGSSSATLQDLGQGFANVGNVARNFGLSVDQTAAILAIFSENGIKGSEAGTQLRSMLLNMSRPTEETRGAWARLGLSLYDADGNMRDLNAIIAELDTALSELPVEEQNELMVRLAGNYGIMGLSALRGSVSIDEMQAKMQEAASAADIAGAKMGDFNTVTDSLMGSVETLQTEALTPLIENTLTPLIEHVTEVINQITAWVQENPELTAQIVTIAAAAAALGPVLIVVGQVLGAIGTIIATLASPIGLVIAAVAALAAAWATDFGGIRTFIESEIFPRLQQFFGWLGQVWETTVRPGLEALYNWFVNEGLPGIIGFIQTYVVPVVEAFFGFLGEVWALVGPALGDLYDWFVVSALPEIRRFVEGPVMTAVTAFRDLLVGIWTAAGPVLRELVAWFANTFRYIGENYIQPVLDFIGRIISKVNEAIAAVQRLLGMNQPQAFSYTQPTRPPVSVQGPTQLPGAPSMDSGGQGIAGLPYLIGRGAQPELFVPETNGQFFPADQWTRLLGGAGDRYEINVMMPAEALASPTAAHERGRDFGAALAEELRRRG